MSWKDAKTAADQWAADAGLSGDLRGRMLIVPVFTDDVDCAFFIPGRVAAFHRMIVQAVSRTARKAGAKVVPLVIRPKDYRAWLRAENRDDNPKLRDNYFRSQTKVV